ncbi:MAG: LysM peptidoglycan-binding domain-containing protein [Myxococcales bacterium]|nr:LysM peptidoglycan-binding domain-containing protein [Myxococcales bacterium]
MSALLPIALLWLGAAPAVEEAPPTEVVVQPGETLAAVARRALGDAESAHELRALNSLAGDKVAPGTALKLPGPDRALALSALAAARNAVDQADSSAANRQEAASRLKEAEALFKSARYREAAKAADGAWQLVSASAREPTRFAVKVEENGKTEVKANSGQPVRVEAEGVATPVYAGQTVKIEKGRPPSSPSSATPPSKKSLFSPVPMEPPDGTRLKEIDAGTLILTWKPVKGATSYVVQLAGPKSATLEVDKPQAALPPLAPGKYQWTVQAANQTEKSNPSRRRSFEVLDQAVKLEVGKSSWK